MSTIPDSHFRDLAKETHNLNLGLPKKTPATSTIAGSDGLLFPTPTQMNALNSQQKDYVTKVIKYFSTHDSSKTGLTGKKLRETVGTIAKDNKEEHTANPTGKGRKRRRRSSRRQRSSRRHSNKRGRSKRNKTHKKIRRRR